jgi:hypothetical protein
MAQASAVQQHDARHAIFMQIIDLLWGYEG